MQSKSFDIDGVKATVTTERGRDMFKKRAMIRAINVDTTDDQEWDVWYEFIRAVTQSTDVETPFVWPDFDDSVEVLKEAREAWLDLPADVLRAWGDALNKVDAPPQAIELTPGADLKNASSQ
jgi:hypothetical protein